jgi:hypothetical protein
VVIGLVQSSEAFSFNHQQIFLASLQIICCCHSIKHAAGFNTPTRERENGGKCVRKSVRKNAQQPSKLAKSIGKCQFSI